MKILALSVFLAALWLPLKAEALSFGKVNLALADQVMIPAYDALSMRTTILERRLGELCEAPDPEKLQRAQAAYRDAMLAWQRTQPIRIGPIARANRVPRMYYWPDKHGTGGRQIR